jgi:hypothetical protein
MRKSAASLLAAFTLAVLPLPLATRGTAMAAEARFEKVFCADSRWAAEGQSEFIAATPKIYVLYDVVNVAPGTRLRAAWYAEKVEGVAENDKFSDVSTRTGVGGHFLGCFSHTRPPRGWPVGLYRVELSIDDRASKTVSFRIVRGMH